MSNYPVVLEEVASAISDGLSGGSSSAHVADPPHGVHSVVFGLVVVEAELQSLVVGELHCTWRPTQRVSQWLVHRTGTLRTGQTHQPELPCRRCRSC